VAQSISPFSINPKNASRKSWHYLWQLLVFAALALVAAQTSASVPTEEAKNRYGHALERPSYVLVDLKSMDALGLKTIHRNEELQIGVAALPTDQIWRLVARSHQLNRCGGFQMADNLDQAISLLTSVEKTERRHRLQASGPLFPQISVNEQELQNLIGMASESDLRSQVEWISAYRSRYHRQADPNQHVVSMESRLKALLNASGLPGSVELITHRSTQQKTVRLRLEGATQPSQVIVVGAHFDSISGWGGSSAAPGADDDASGSANALEAAKIIMSRGIRPSRTLEFFWYAAEEAGLLGSKEVADAYAQEKKDVVAVLQLDMTLFPGNGEHVIGNIGDHTNPWLREYLRQLNERFLKVRLVDDECGYGCSDHASWHARGFATLLPFEATSNTMNRNIHTTRDLIDARSNFKHSNTFTQIALLFAWDLGNSSLRP